MAGNIIQINEGGIHVENKQLSFPISLGTLTQLFGAHSRKEGTETTTYTWDTLGVIAYSGKRTEEIEALSFIYNDTYKSIDSYPKNECTYTLTINSKHYNKNYAPSKSELTIKYIEKEIGIIHAVLVFNEEALESITISKSTQPLLEKVPDDYYAFKKCTGSKIDFVDFNFKLAVIQVLMYEKELLKPIFDIHQFIKTIHTRTINLEEEGYSYIPEVIDYFKTLEIDQTYADYVTEINQSGGDEVYANILYFWDGEDDSFDIKHFDDIVYFKKLKKISLFNKKSLSLQEEEFIKSKGIDL